MNGNSGSLTVMLSILIRRRCLRYSSISAEDGPEVEKDGPEVAKDGPETAEDRPGAGKVALDARKEESNAADDGSGAL